eukprot:gb/GEZN01005666.1/.p1 GENE.gb/GEZN01005666.1/~~gb/GEZN01005666.1/.p1  ORF type:complete len:456 (-),score=24.60 gb/GEZN01005666.1/:332-1699(-)
MPVSSSDIYANSSNFPVLVGKAFVGFRDTIASKGGPKIMELQWPGLGLKVPIKFYADRRIRTNTTRGYEKVIDNRATFLTSELGPDYAPGSASSLQVNVNPVSALRGPHALRLNTEEVGPKREKLLLAMDILFKVEVFAPHGVELPSASPVLAPNHHAREQLEPMDDRVPPFSRGTLVTTQAPPRTRDRPIATQVKREGQVKQGRSRMPVKYQRRYRRAPYTRSPPRPPSPVSDPCPELLSPVADYSDPDLKPLNLYTPEKPGLSISSSNCWYAFEDKELFEDKGLTTPSIPMVTDDLSVDLSFVTSPVGDSDLSPFSVSPYTRSSSFATSFTTCTPKLLEDMDLSVPFDRSDSIKAMRSVVESPLPKRNLSLSSFPSFSSNGSLLDIDEDSCMVDTLEAMPLSDVPASPAPCGLPASPMTCKDLFPGLFDFTPSCQPSLVRSPSLPSLWGFGVD